MYWMVQRIFFRGMSVSDLKFAWFYAYLDCGYSTANDTPLFNVSVWKRVRAFPGMRKKYKYMKKITKFLERADKRVVAGRDSGQQNS